MSMDGWERLEARIVFFNGVKEINFENVAINPYMEYTELASNVSRIISFPQNQLSIYLVKNPDSREPEGPEITLVTPESIKAALRCSKEDILLVVLNESKMSRSPFEWDGFNENLVNSQRKEPEPRLFSEVLKAVPQQKLRVPTKDNQAITARQILNLDSNENKNADHPSVNESVARGFRTTVGPTARPRTNVGPTAPPRTNVGPTAPPIDDPAVSAWVKFRKSANK